MDKLNKLPFKQSGAFYKDGSCEFITWAPLLNSVEVYLPGKDSYHAMTRDEDGYWSARLDGIKPGDLYLFRLDGDKTLPDVASFQQPDGVHKASAVVDLSSFNWSDTGWKGLPLEEMIIYELHIGTFTVAGTFLSAIEKLDHLKELGINTIEIMPVAQFPGQRNWGYDGVYPHAVQHNYGGIDGLKQFVNAAHSKGLAVLLDVVYNHIGPEGNYLEAYGPYFTDKYRTPWGKALNYDGEYSDGVRDFFLQNAWLWLYNCHIDGLRLDAVHAIYDSSALHFLEQLNQLKRTVQKQSGSKKVLIAEFDLNNPKYALPETQGGFGLDGQWIDEFHHAMHALITGELNGYYEDFGTLEHLHKAFTTGYVYTGEYSKTRKRKFGVKPAGLQPSQFVSFSQNHDHIGNRMIGDRLTATLNENQLRLIAASYLLAPFVPLVFMGEEYGEKNPFQYFVDHGDPALVEAVRRGRKEEFSYFQKEGQEVPDPFDENTFSRSTLSWKLKDEEHRRMFEYYKELIHIRKTHGAFRDNSWKGIKVWELQGNNKVIAFERNHNGCKALVVLNYEANDSRLSLEVPATLFFTSTDYASASGSADGNVVTLPAFSATIFNL